MCMWNLCCLSYGFLKFIPPMNVFLRVIIWSGFTKHYSWFIMFHILNSGWCISFSQKFAAAAYLSASLSDSIYLALLLNLCSCRKKIASVISIRLRKDNERHITFEVEYIDNFLYCTVKFRCKTTMNSFHIQQL